MSAMDDFVNFVTILILKYWTDLTEKQFLKKQAYQPHNTLKYLEHSFLLMSEGGGNH